MPEPLEESLSIIVASQFSNIAAQTTLDLQGLITMMKANGMSDIAIKEALMNDLTTGGRLFGSFRNQVKNTVRSGIRIAGNNASMTRFKEEGIEEFVWVTVSKNPCPDCAARAGEVATMEYWENLGVPASGFSVCQGNCKCVFEALGYKGDTTIAR